MNIGEVAALSGVNARMIRRYEDEGIIPKAGRSLAGYRTYSSKDVPILRFVKHARELGFSIKDLKQLVGLWRNESRPSSQVKSISQKHVQELEQKRIEIENMLKTLQHLMKSCHGDQRPDCPILEGIESL